MSFEQAQEELQNALTTTFLANLVFLSEYDNKLYQRVDELSRMIENKKYVEKYALEFIPEEGDFDIYDIKNNRYLYGKKPNKINNKLINEVQFDTKKSIFSLENIYYKDQNVKPVPDDIRYNLIDLNHAYWLTKHDISDFTSYLKGNLNEKKKKLKNINKFVFFGTLLGRHIPRIAQKLNAESYLVCERNLEIFRLSLFTVDYTILAKNGVIFSVMDTKEEENIKLGYFIHQNFLKNFLFKFSTTSINVKEYIEVFLQNIIAYQPTTYDYNRYLYTFIKRTSERINEKYKIMLSNKTKEQFTFFENKKVLFIAAGPSLDENIEWIKENQNKFFIVTIGAVYEKLIDSGIGVDMISTVDEQLITVETKHFTLKAVEKIRNSIVLASTLTNKNVLERFNFKNLFLFESFVPFFKNNIVVQGFSVGETTLGLLLCMNVKELYIVGLDLSVNQETGDSHSLNATSEIKKSNLNNEKTLSFEDSKKYFSSRTGFIEVKGNKKEKVYTKGVLSSSILCMNSHVVNFKNEDARIYNLSSTGAYFEKTVPCDIDSIDVKKFDDCIYKKNELLIELENSSEIGLNSKSKNRMEKELETLTEYLNKGLLKYKEKENEDYESFYKEVLEIYDDLIKITSENTSILSILLQRYFQIIVNYLSFYFNDINIKKEKEKIEEVKRILIKQIKRLLKDYIKFLDKL